MNKQQYAEQFGRWRAENEIVIEFEDNVVKKLTPEVWEAASDTGLNFVKAGFKVEIRHAEGSKSIYILLKGFDKSISGAEAKALVLEYVRPEFQHLIDFSFFASRHRLPREDETHRKYGTPFALLGKWNEDKQNVFPEDVLVIKQEQKREVKGSGITAQIILKVSIIYVAKKYGLEVDSRGFALCPFHADNNPSLKFYDSQGRFVCFGCRKQGNIIEFVKQMKRLNV